VLAYFRVHEKSTGWDLARAGVAIRDHVHAVDLISSYVPPEMRRDVRRRSLQSVARYGLDTAGRLVDHGAVGAGIRCGFESLLVSRTPEELVAFVRLARQALLQVTRSTRGRRGKSAA
jgi:hypothetical protein